MIVVFFQRHNVICKKKVSYLQRQYYYICKANIILGKIVSYLQRWFYPVDTGRKLNVHKAGIQITSCVYWVHAQLFLSYCKITTFCAPQSRKKNCVCFSKEQFKLPEFFQIFIMVLCYKNGTLLVNSTHIFYQKIKRYNKDKHL